MLRVEVRDGAWRCAMVRGLAWRCADLRAHGFLGVRRAQVSISAK
ncbi:hypothetical protein HMPREF1492_0077 [Atopobium sp. BS2]|nr:hypothetical protein HMPREF1492_0077 [Atopobium sp. BS2]